MIIAIVSGKAHADSAGLSIKAELMDRPKELASAVREIVDCNAIAISDKTGIMATFWLRKELPLVKAKSGYESIAPGTLIGVVQLHRAWNDFRGNEAPAGVYTLRFALQPKTKDHEGTAPYREFCILLPAAEDTRPDPLTLKTIVEKSGKATGGTHPVVMLLVPHPKPKAKPSLLVKDKRTAVGSRVNVGFGVAFTIIGSFTD